MLLVAEDMRKAYIYRRRPVPVLDGLSFSVEAGEILCVLGPSGCGKSTLLRILAGLEPPDGGRVWVRGRPVQPGSPEIGLVLQQPHLLPWRTVRGNVAFGIEFVVRDRREVARRVEAALERLGLQEVADWRPHLLSGGMAQRVALAHALVRRPRVLLLDEPFSSLDAPTRQALGTLVRRLSEEDGISVVMVTHDIGEALSVGHQVLVLSPRPARTLLSVKPDGNGRLQEALLAALGPGALVPVGQGAA